MSRRCDYYPSDTNKNQIKWMVIVATDPGLLMNGDFCFYYLFIMCTCGLSLFRVTCHQAGRPWCLYNPVAITK